MKTMLGPPAAALALITISAHPAAAQPFEVAGTRAQGMGGAFVGVADDASAVYWNPGGLASGAYFSLVMDRSGGEATPDDIDVGANDSSWMIAISAPVVGLSYYRLRSTVAGAAPLVAPGRNEVPAGTARLESLITHHAGATFVQTLAEGLAVGATLKLVRGIATAGDFSGVDTEDLLDDGENVVGEASNRFDVDVGIMKTGPIGRIGLVVRNLTEPGFDATDGSELELERQARAGASLVLTERWMLSADFDLTRSAGAFGDERHFAVGTEGRVHTRAVARAGIRLNTAGDRGRQPAVSFGATYAAMGSLLVDAQVTAGSEDAPRGWGLAGRVIF